MATELPLLRSGLLAVAGALLAAAALGGCGLTDTGAAAVSGAESQAQQAAQARQTEERVRQQVEEANRAAAERDRAAADAAGR